MPSMAARGAGRPGGEGPGGRQSKQDRPQGGSGAKATV